MLKIGIIGYGYWGPNIVRNFHGLEGVKIHSICDKNPDVVSRIKRSYPEINTCSDHRDITESSEIDAVAIITPVFAHYQLAKEALENGKHIFVEKPFTSTSSQAEELIELAEKKNLKIMVDYTFLFTGAVRKLKDLIQANTLGDLYYYDSTRVNLGLFQHDVNVIWDLAPHDFSIMDFLIPSNPVAISAHGTDHFGRNLENIAYVTVYLENNIMAHFNFNWMSPVKIRKTLIGGEHKMLVWDDLENDEKIKIYDKGVKIESQEGLYNLLVEYRSGDMLSPKVEAKEALRIEAEYFIDCILNDKTPVNDGYAGLRIVRLLELSDDSIKNSGKVIELDAGRKNKSVLMHI